MDAQLIHALPATVARLVAAVQELSQARTVESVREIVRHAARELVGADGATFVLRDGDKCHYVDEDAIQPLWKGQRFPMTACISGWAMLHKEPVAIQDITVDDRIPQDVYRQTFVRSLVMVPIRPGNPIGAIGTYWATQRSATLAEVEVLQALANTTAVAMENVKVYEELEMRVQHRTRLLEQANVELESFAASVSHDLRAPLAVIGGYAELLQMRHQENSDEQSKKMLAALPAQVQRMSQLIGDLLRLARIRKTELKLMTVDLSAIASELGLVLGDAEPGRKVELQVESTTPIMGDEALIRIAMENLLANAWKYTRKKERPHIRFGERMGSSGLEYFVQDDGVGFPAQDVGKLFRPFNRLHSSADYPGTGVGLSIVANVIEKHGGRVWGESSPQGGATFCFTIGTRIAAS